MAHDLTQKILKSPWKKVGSIYIFSAKNSDMIADETDTRLRDIQQEIEQVAAGIFDKATQQTLYRLAEDLHDYDDSQFLLRIRGVGAGLDQQAILDHVVNLQNQHVEGTPLPS